MTTTSSPAGRSRLKLAASYEAGIWRSLYRWLNPAVIIHGRPDH
jgi:hypothetical protein